jgi:hypothetical protein
MSPTDLSRGAAVASPSCGSGSHWWLLGTLTTAIFFLGWGGLVVIAAHYRPATGSRRRIGQLLQGASVGTAAGTLIARLSVHTDRCGRARGAAGDLEAWLFLVTVVLFMLGVVLAAHGTQATEWVAIAAVAVADFGLVPIFLGNHQSHRGAIVVVLCVHGGCTAVAAWWARQVRAGMPPARAKAAETGRVLAGGWLVLLLLAIAAAGEPVGAILPDTTFIGLFVVAAISTVTGTGYTRYVEAKYTLTAPPDPDTLDQMAAGLTRVLVRLLSWHRAYREWF